MDRTVAAPPNIPRHVRVLGGLAVLWNAVGAFDYVMTQTRNDAYMSNFTPAQIEYFYGFPAWVVAFWATAVWGGVLGSGLLLLGKRIAVPVLLTSFVAMVVTSIHNFVLSDGVEVSGPGGMAFSALIFVVALGLWLYARALGRSGRLA